ncbi:hypothetical protein DPMN_133175 [Dreissena polymorpha]|uniref:Uncharacterized protein n=1 Tax=Dreissena polymorpha TaxID=45954 RepID=A0A9D4FXD9_DREPO|nr:hypothetical protein DPMN_133175 [Dreissena polymorpha]
MRRDSKVNDQVVDCHHGNRRSPGEEVNAARDERCFLDHLNINSLLNAFSYGGMNIISK